MTDLDTFPVAVTFAIVAGGLALALPFLNSLAAALAALAAAGYAARRGRTARAPWPRPSAAVVVGWASGLAGGLSFLLLPDPWSTARGLALGLSLVPLVRADRRAPAVEPAGRLA